MATSMTQLLRKAAQSRMTGQPPAEAATSDIRQEEPIASGAVTTVDPIKLADKPSRKIEQTKPTVESISLVQQLNSTDEQTNQADKSDRQTDYFSEQNKHIKQAHKANLQSKHTKTTIKLNPKKEHTKQTDQPSRQTAPTMRLPPRLPLRTAAQKILAGYFLETGPIVTTYAVIAAETGVPLGTTRTIIDKFLAAGWLRKEQWGAGCNRALSLAPTDALAISYDSKQAEKTNTQTQHAKQHYKPNTQVKQLNQTVEINRGKTSLKIDRKNLSIDLETLQTSWPSLARAGFGLEQLEQILGTLAQLGKSTDRIVQGLDHAEWELSEGKMLDKTGQPVADPCAWVFRSLSSQGYYRRPAGYVSAEEQAELDAAIEAKALAQSRENARLARFRAWEQGISREEREKALEGRRGPEEAWLKNVWTKCGEPT